VGRLLTVDGNLLFSSMIMNWDFPVTGLVAHPTARLVAAMGHDEKFTTAQPVDCPSRNLHMHLIDQFLFLLNDSFCPLPAVGTILESPINRFPAGDTRAGIPRRPGLSCRRLKPLHRPPASFAQQKRFTLFHPDQGDEKQAQVVIHPGAVGTRLPAGGAPCRVFVHPSGFGLNTGDQKHDILEPAGSADWLLQACLVLYKKNTHSQYGKHLSAPG
jgi:hypothetical protein